MDKETPLKVAEMGLRLQVFEKKLQELETKFVAVMSVIDVDLKKIKDNSNLTGRIEDIEIWRAKIHDMLVTKNPVTEKERLTATARKKRGNYFFPTSK